MNMRTLIFLATLSVTAVAAPTPPSQGGTLQITTEIGGRTVTQQVAYLGSGVGAARVSLGSESLSTSITTEVVTTYSPLHRVDVFTLDSQYATSGAFFTNPSDGIFDGGGYSYRVKSMQLDQTGMVGESNFHFTFSATYDHGEDAGTASLDGHSWGPVSLLSDYFANTALSQGYAFDGSRLTTRTDSAAFLTSSEETLGGGLTRSYVYLRATEFYYRASVPSPDGSFAVFHRNFKDGSGNYLPIGKVVRTETGNEATTTGQFTAATAYAGLQAATTWGTFSGNPVRAPEIAAGFSYSDGQANGTKTAYRMTVPADSVKLVLWDEIFIPAGATEAADVRTLAWKPGAGETESPVYVLDPFEPGNPHRFYAQPGTYRVTNVRTVNAFLDVDADNTTLRANYPDRTRGDQGAAERLAKNSTDDVADPGVYVPINNGDINTNGVPGYADGINRFGNNNLNASSSFAPAILSVYSKGVSPGGVFVFRYSASDPALLEKTTGGRYQLPTGEFRIWTKDGPQVRNASAVDQGGNFVAENVPYTAEQLGWASDSRTMTFFVEVVRAGPTSSVSKIVVDYYPLGTERSDVKCSESAKFTSFENNDPNPL